MKLWPFSRKKDEQSDLPKEVQDYYQAEKREKVGVAGLLALGTLLVTILLAIGLFFGGRWVYRTVFDNDDSQQTAQTDESESAEEEGQNESDQNESSQNDEQANENEDEPAPAPNQPAPSQNQPTPNPATPAPAPNTTPAPGTNTQGKGGSDLPTTGPEDTLAIFLGTVLAASLLFYLVKQPERR